MMEQAAVQPRARTVITPPSKSSDEALTLLFNEHSGLIYNLGLRLCGSEESAKDLVQETFLRAFRNWHTFEGRSSPATWLYTIAMRAYSRINRRRTDQPLRVAPINELLPSESDDISDIPASDDDGPLSEVLRREAKEVVYRTIGSLPLPFRMAFILKDIVEFSVKEVAEVLGIKEATVKTRVHRARLLVRKELTKHLPKRKVLPAEYSKEICLSLLHSKQSAMDRSVDFPLAHAELCSRCCSLFAELDLAHDACIELKQGRIPEHVRQLLINHLNGMQHDGQAESLRPVPLSE